VVHPYLGGGAGVVQFNNDTDAFLGADTNTSYASEFGYQAGAGVGFTLAPRLTLSVDYRHLWTQKAGFTINPFPAVVGPFRMDERYLADTAMISVRYFLGPAAPPPPVAAPPPPPPPAPVTAPAPPPPPVAVAPAPCNPPAGFKVDANCHIIDQTFVVHGVDFELNSTKLTIPSAEALDQAARAFAAEPQLRVEVQGFTDSTGPREYNLKLSQGRADSVRTYLIGRGVDGSALTAHGYGPDSPVASNATKEGRAQNRRVTFNIINAPAHVKVNTEDATPESTEAAEHVDPAAKPQK
jgi:outer membrane protein OmpA-like peptidoglycan-associated protein